MRNIPLAVEEIGFSEDDVLLVELVLAFDETDTLKPDQVDEAGTVGKMRHQPPFPSFSKGFKGGDLPLQLDVGLRLVNLVHVVHPRPVDISIGVPPKQVSQRKDIELLLQDIGSFGSHAGNIFYFGLKNMHCLSRVSCKCK